MRITREVALTDWTVDVELDANQYSTIRIANGTCYGDTEREPIATVYDADHAKMIAVVPEFLETLREFVSDVETAYSSGMHILEIEWPDLYVTYEHAKAAIYKAEGRGQ